MAVERRSPAMPRRLAAILAAEVVGYADLMRADPTATRAALRAMRRELAGPLLARHHGRITAVRDGVAVVQFASVVDALRCAAATQRGAAKCMPSEPRITYRMGIHLGDALAADAIATAMRLREQAAPGRILVSTAVRDHVGDLAEFQFVPAGPSPGSADGGTLRALALELQPRTLPVAQPPVPARPSVAVLPFENLTRDTGENYLSAGIAEDLITELSKISGLFVTGRPSSFAMRPTPQDAMETCARLKVGYVLSGSVRRVGERVRITARLVEGATGGQVWAERYDRTLTDLFAVQEEIARSIAAALEVKLLRAEREALARPPTGNLEAYQLYLRGLALFGQRVRPSYELARRMFARAAELDPDFARALAAIAECECGLYMHCGAEVDFATVLVIADRAIALEPSLAAAHAARGVGLAALGRRADAERAFERAIAVDPGHAGAHYAYARACVEQGRRDEGARLLRRAADLAPDDVGYLSTLYAVLSGLGRPQEAIATAREAVARCERQLARHPDFTVAAFTGAGALALLGERERALEWADRALAIEPDDHMTLYNVACVYALLGLPEQAIDLLERAMPGASAHRQAWMRQDSDMDPLREHPRFRALCARLDKDN